MFVSFSQDVFFFAFSCCLNGFTRHSNHHAEPGEKWAIIKRRNKLTRIVSHKKIEKFLLISALIQPDCDHPYDKQR